MSAGKGSVPVQHIRNDYSSTNVTTSAYVELDSALDGDVSELEIFDSSGQTLVLAIGAAGSEQDQFYIPPGGLERQTSLLSSGQRLSIKAVSANATTGELIINMWR